MRTFLTPLALATALICGAAAPAWADFDDGWAAYEAGDYATALKGAVSLMRTDPPSPRQHGAQVAN